MLLLLGTATFSHVFFFSPSLSPPGGREDERPDSPSYLTEGNCQRPHTLVDGFPGLLQQWHQW